MARDLSESPVRHRRSPRRRSPSRREGSPKSHVSRSPSPRTKRLRRAQVEKEGGRNKEREHDKHNGRGSEKTNSRDKEREREREREGERDRGEKRREREGERDRGEKRREREIETEKIRYRGRERDLETGDKRRHSGREETDDRRRAGRDDEKHSRERHERSYSPERAIGSRHNERSNTRGDDEHNDEEDSLAKMKAAEEALTAKQKEQPSFELSGKLAAETNRYRGITLLFNEPPDARKPSTRWRLYVFKGGEPLNEPLYIHRQSCYLFGRERRIADIPTDHPSCSKQHAVIQFRLVEKEAADGMMSKQVKPYIMDLGSTNKTYINDNPIEPQRYYELFEKDTIRFGNSSREYVLLHENSTA